jgi:hypothetical protein
MSKFDIDKIDWSYFNKSTSHKISKFKHLIHNNGMTNPINLSDIGKKIWDVYHNSFEIKKYQVDKNESNSILKKIKGKYKSVNNIKHSDENKFTSYINTLINDPEIEKIEKYIINNITLYVFCQCPQFNIYYLLKRIYVLQLLFQDLFPSKGQKLKIYAALTNENRSLLKNKINPFDKSEFDEQINKMKSLAGGLTVSGLTFSDSNEIFLYKKEEIGRLLIHEFAHYIDLDYVPKETESYNNIWATTKKHLNAYEAYSELISDILNAIFISAEYSIDYGLNYDNFVTLCNYFIDIEYAYSFYLSAKLLTWYGRSSNDLINFFQHDTNNFPLAQEPIYLSEYIYLRALLWLTWNQWSEFVDKNLKIIKPSHGNIFQIVFKNNNINNLVENIKKFMKINENDDNLSITYGCLDFNYST